jgi:hypothetical protein
MIQLEANTDLTKERGTLTNFDHAVLACAERVKKKIRPNAQLDRLCGEVAAKIAERDRLTADKAANARDEADEYHRAWAQRPERKVTISMIARNRGISLSHSRPAPPS